MRVPRANRCRQRPMLAPFLEDDEEDDDEQENVGGAIEQQPPLQRLSDLSFPLLSSFIASFLFLSF